MEALSFKIGPEAFNVIMAALGELPHKVASPVISDLVAQVQAQQPPAAPGAVTPDLPPVDITESK